MAKRKLLYFLNNDDEYHKRIKQETIKKYDINLVDGIYK